MTRFVGNSAASTLLFDFCKAVLDADFHIRTLICAKLELKFEGVRLASSKKGKENFELGHLINTKHIFYNDHNSH